MTPLAKRLPRELRRNIGKYLGIFLLMCGSIALTSGFLLFFALHHFALDFSVLLCYSYHK